MYRGLKKLEITAMRRSLDYCIATWDPDHTGALVEPHHNTYDINYFGPDGHCGSFYLGALAAAVKMGEATGDDVAQALHEARHDRPVAGERPPPPAEQGMGCARSPLH